MAVSLQIFSLYKLILPDGSNEYLLLRTEQPSYSNTDQGQEDIANKIEAQKRQLLLNAYINQHASVSQSEFVGELHHPPIGEKLFSEKGLFRLSIFYQQTEYGFPWIILGNAGNVNSFERELKDDDELLSLRPTGSIEQVEAIFVTENDFDLKE